MSAAAPMPPVRFGLLDAPQLKGNRFGKGDVVTRIVDGACLAVDPAAARPLPEAERIDRLVAAARTAA